MPELNFAISQHFLDDRGQRAGFVLLGFFLASFLFIRTSARLIRDPKVTWWPGSVTTKGGLHLHHLVWGIVLVLASGFLNFVLQPGSPWLEIFAAGFGIGAGLTLDEFALWIHLEDVYWSKEGRASIDAVVVATLLGGLIVLGIAPFGPGYALVVAMTDGLFSSEGLAVTSSVATGSPEAIARVASGTSEFAVVDINALIRFRSQASSPVKAVFVLFNKSPYAIIARKSRGIRALSDIEGKTLGVAETDLSIRLWPALARQNGRRR